jgi:hypothetical protein
MRSTYAPRYRRRTRRPLGCAVLVIGAGLLLAVAGTRTGRNWGVPSLVPSPTPVATIAIVPNDALVQETPTPLPVVDTPPPAPTVEALVQETPTPLPVADTQPPAPTADPYRQWIHEAREQYPYPDSEDRMYAVLLCESGGDPAIISPDGYNHGLFQYSAATWAGDWNPYREESIYDARAQIFATACAWSLGMQGQWGCYTNP